MLCAALIANDADVALYEEGTFVPQLAVTVFERLIKKPSAYSVRRWRIGGVRATVFRQLAEMLGKQWETTKITKRNVLDVVRPLLKFIQQLPEFTKSTDQLTEQAKRVRAALLQTREADQLLFVELPRACGMDPVEPVAHLPDTKTHAFVSELRKSLGELQRHYEVTLSDVGQALGSAFGISGTNAVIRERLNDRANSPARLGRRSFSEELRDTNDRRLHGREDMDRVRSGPFVASVPPMSGVTATEQSLMSPSPERRGCSETLSPSPCRQMAKRMATPKQFAIGITTKEGGDVERGDPHRGRKTRRN